MSAVITTNHFCTDR